MKKLTLIAIVIFVSCTVAVAQPRAIGGRLSYSIGASYQHGFGEKNMLQADLDLLGYWYGGQATITYNWIIPIKEWNIGTFNAFAGGGVGGGYKWGLQVSNINYPWGLELFTRNRYGFVGLAANGGVEFNFQFGLQLSAEWRPLFALRFYENENRDIDFYVGGLYKSAVALGVRYRLGK